MAKRNPNQICEAPDEVLSVYEHTSEMKSSTITKEESEIDQWLEERNIQMADPLDIIHNFFSEKKKKINEIVAMNKKSKGINQQSSLLLQRRAKINNCKGENPMKLINDHISSTQTNLKDPNNSHLNNQFEQIFNSKSKNISADNKNLNEKVNLQNEDSFDIIQSKIDKALKIIEKDVICNHQNVKFDESKLK